jgi:ATP-dependent RNA helicase DOB1
MNANDLFSFLDQPQDDVDDSMESQESDVKQIDYSRKRKASSPTPSSQNGELSSPENELTTSSSKKQRLASPKPVVVDEVEIEAKREVAASAGLTDSVEAGSRLELRHQARFFTDFEYPSTHIVSRFGIKLLYHRVLIMFQ